MITVKVSSVTKALEKMLSNLDTLGVETLRFGMEIATIVGQQNIAAKTVKRTGDLLGGFRPVFISGDTATLFNVSEHASYIEEGTRAHGPVTAEFLRFQIGGHWIKTKWVRGITARPFMQPAAFYAEFAMQKFANEHLDKMASRF